MKLRPNQKTGESEMTSWRFLRNLKMRKILNFKHIYDLLPSSVLEGMSEVMVTQKT